MSSGNDGRAGGRASGAFEVDDLLGFRLIRDVDISPDGRTLVVEVEEIDREGDQPFSNLWLVASEGGQRRPLTFGRKMSTSPRFSPDGSRLAYVSNRDGAPAQLYVLSLEGGEPRRLTTVKGGAIEPVWSPDGSRIAFSAPVTGDRPAHAPRVVTRASYKSDGVGFVLDRPTQLFVVDAEAGDARQLTTSDASAMNPAWSPDGRTIAFVRMRNGKRDAHRSDVWVVDATGSGLRGLTKACAHVMSPTWSPDGRTIAFYAARKEGEGRRQLWTVSLSGGDERTVTSEDDDVASFPLARSRPPVWTSDGRALVVPTVSATRSSVARVDVATGTSQSVASGDRQITMVTSSPSAERIAFVWADLRVCGKLSTVRWDGTDERLVADVNDAWSRDRRWPRASLRDFPGASEPTNHGLLLLPEGTGPWPLLVDVHGGPHSYVELGFPYHPYWYVLVSRGWAVLALNPPGSASYGKAFSERLRGSWGEADLPEQLAAVDALVAEGIADGSRVAIAGKSYGGYMVAWAIGQTDRFRAAAFSAGVTNLESHFGTSDSGYYVDPHNLSADIVEDRERYRRLSPIGRAHLARTPTLILQGEDDERCPKGQAEELFAALLTAGKTEVEMVLYPGGSHRLAESGRPSHRVDYNRRIVAWLERHCA